MTQQPSMGDTVTVTLLEPAPRPHYRRLTARVCRSSQRTYRIANRAVTGMRELGDDRVALDTTQGAWIISRRDYDRIQALLLRPRRSPPPAHPSERTQALVAEATCAVRGRDGRASLLVQRLTDALFLVGNQSDERRVILGFLPQADQTVVALVHDGALQLTPEDYQALLGLPAWKANLKQAARRDGYGQRLHAEAARLVVAQAIPALVQQHPCDPALVLRVLSQIAAPASHVPVDVLGVPLPVRPAFLVDTAPPRILDDLPSPDPCPHMRGLEPPIAASLDELVGRVVAGIQHLEGQRAAAARRAQERGAAAEAVKAAQAAHQRLLIAQRDAALARLADPQRLEAALAILVYVNRWAKAHEKLLSADRRGLYAVKTAILAAGYATGHITAVGYIQGHFQPFGGMDLPWCADTVVNYCLLKQTASQTTSSTDKVSA
jgi:hypothetical protein